MLHWLCNGTYNRRKHKHYHAMQTIKWNQLTIIFSVHMFICHQNTYAIIFFHTANFHSFFLQSGSPWQEQNIAHGMLDLLQLHRCVLHGMLLGHEHLINFSKSIGASKVSAGTVVGISTLDPSSLNHPTLVGFRTGGFGSKACNQTATWRWALATFSLNASLVGGSEQSLAHWLCFYQLWAPILLSCFCEWWAVWLTIACKLAPGYPWTIHLQRCCPRRWGYAFQTSTF